jgi:aminopeptidase-like protein
VSAAVAAQAAATSRSGRELGTQRELGTEPELGEQAHQLMRRLFPLCRSLTGAGVRATFEVLQEYIPLTTSEVASGTRVFDWTVPDEWNIRDAYVAAPDGTRVIDYRRSNLHVVSYSEPVRARMSLEELRPRLHTLPDRPEVVPYRTSYYERSWGFCLSHRQLHELEPGEYEVVIDATLAPGHLTYAELLLEGQIEDEILISTYVCHPSLANDNLSGVVAATMLAQQLARQPRHHSFRFLFAPGTIGPLCWLHGNRERLEKIRHGLTIACIGDDGPFTYKRSRRGDAEIDRAAEIALRDLGSPFQLVEFEPWGGDERQFCSPGFDLPLGSLARTAHAAHAVNHTSEDGLDQVRPASLQASICACLAIIEALETNRMYANLSPYGEPQLGRRGLYRAAGGAVARPEDEQALLWVLNLSDGSQTLLDIAARSALPYATVTRAARRLEEVGLLGAASGSPQWSEAG